MIVAQGARNRSIIELHFNEFVKLSVLDDREIHLAPILFAHIAKPIAINTERTGKIKIIGVAGPANMPAPLVKQVNAVFTKALSTNSVKEAIGKGAYEAAPSTPEEASAELKLAFDRWAR